MSALKDSMLFDNLVTLSELLDWLRHNYSKWTVYKWVQEGMPHKKIGNKLWFSKQDVSLWLERR